MRVETTNASRPRVTILADGDPLAGDVAACLSGRYQVESAPDAGSAARRIAAGTRALIIMAGDDPLETEVGGLIRQAATAHCRVVILGLGGLDPDGVLDGAVIRLPHLPAPRDLFASLAGLGPGTMAGQA